VNKVNASQLTGVSETALWTLWNRAVEAQRPDRVADDSVAVELAERIDYPYRQRFGVTSQMFSIRAHAFDAVVREHLEAHPNAAVVALAEGLQTSYWRLGRPASTWITVDLPPIIALREQLLPHEQHVVNVASSAFDRGWMDVVPTNPPPIITAEGLFMYFEEAVVVDLIRECARRYPGGALVCDGIPDWWARKKSKTIGSKRNPDTQELFVAPPMLSAISAHRAMTLLPRIDGVASVIPVAIPPGRGLIGRLHAKTSYTASVIPARWRSSLHLLRFKSKSQTAP
jgi:O-methyltransferase involved in polyketide biosynthesis